MLTRRELLLGSSALALSVTHGSSAATIVAEGSALDLIGTRIKASMEHCIVFDELESIPADWRTFVPLLSDKAELDRQIQETLQQIFKLPVFLQARSRGSIFDDEGRLRPSLQMLFVDKIPILPSECDEALFQAYMSKYAEGHYAHI